MPGDLKATIMDLIEEQREMGVLVNYAWPNMSSSVTSAPKVNILAQYCGFSGSEEMTAYADTVGKCPLSRVPTKSHAYFCSIVSDIVHEAALLASNSRRKCSDIDDGDLPHSLV